MTALAEKGFMKRLLKLLWRRSLKNASEKGGSKLAIALGLSVVDGPVPIGDALAAIFLLDRERCLRSLKLNLRRV